VPSIAETVGASRIVPGVSIPFPLGNPALSHDEEYKVRMDIFKRCLTALSTDLDVPRFF